MNSPNLHDFLMNHPYVVVLVGLALCILAAVLPKPGKIILIIVYLAFIAYMTLLLREAGDPEGKFEFFWSYRQFLTSQYYRTEILLNIWLFVPFGALMYSLFKNRALILIPFLVSLIVEVIQLIFGFGLFEFDDIISNTLGGAIGFFIAYTVMALIRDRQPVRSLES